MRVTPSFALVILALLVFLVALPTSRADAAFAIGGGLGYTQTSMSEGITIRVGAPGGGMGTTIDLVDTLGMEKSTGDQAFGLSFRLLLLRGAFSYASFGFSGRRVLSQDITVGDTTYSTGTAVESTLDGLWADGWIGIDLMQVPFSPLSLGPVFRMHYLEPRFEVRAHIGGQDYVDGDGMELAIPQIGGFGELAVGNLTLELVVSGMYVPALADVQGTVVTTQLTALLSLGKLFIGVRAQNTNLQVDVDSVHFGGRFVLNHWMILGVAGLNF